MHRIDPRQCIHLLPSDARLRCDRCRRVDQTFGDVLLILATCTALWSVLAVVASYVTR